jgi:hypothetical protein
MKADLPKRAVHLKPDSYLAVEYCGILNAIIKPGLSDGNRREQMTWFIFAGAGLFYAAFWSWYVGFGHKMSPAKIERVLTELKRVELTEEQHENFRNFFETDDGKEFVMVNALHFKKPVLESQKLFSKYSAAFRDPLIKRAGHPVVMATAAARNIENVNCDQADDWSVGAVVRYRSRADFAEIALLFAGSENHQDKLDAMEKTFAFPASPRFMMGGPRVIVGLVLALGAALSALAVG